ncbi:MAG: hypothetical protein ACO2ZJ_00545, partial [Pseudohongiellaceae bacterium]
MVRKAAVYFTKQLYYVAAQRSEKIRSNTGCNGIACAMEGLLTPESAKVFCGPGLAEVCETVGIPPVLHLGSCVDNSRILLAATEVV